MCIYIYIYINKSNDRNKKVLKLCAHCRKLFGKKEAKKNEISQRHGTNYHEIYPHNLIQCFPISFLYIYIEIIIINFDLFP